MTKTFTVAGTKKTETFTIQSVESMDHLPHMAARLIENGKEAKQYTMLRVVEGTRKIAYTIPCWRFADSDSFMTIL